MGQDKIDPTDPLVVIAFILAFFGDLTFFLVITHWILGIIALIILWRRFKGWLPKANFMICILIPLPPLLIIGIIQGIILSNKFIAALTEQVIIQGVAAVTGGAGEALEGVAAGAEGAEVAAGGAELAAEGAETAAEVGEGAVDATEAGEGAEGVEGAEEEEKPRKNRLRRPGQSEDEEDEEKQPEEEGGDEEEALEEEMQTESERDPEEVARRGLFEMPDATETRNKEGAEEERPQKQDRPRRKVIDINIFKEAQRLQQQKDEENRRMEEDRRRKEQESIDKAA